MPPQQQERNECSGGGSGFKEVLYDGHLYDVSSWIGRHPGGSIIKFYMAKGEDATLPIQQFHNRSLNRTLGIMRGLPKRKATPEELGLSPETVKKHQALSMDFKTLEAELRAEGLFEPSLSHTLYRFVELIVLELVGIWCLSAETRGLQLLGVLLNAMFAGRCGWFMHEGGHHSITGKPKVDRFIQSLVYGLGDGMSAVWWSSQHNRHHAMPQRLHHDVDLDTLPLLAFNKKVADKSQRQGFLIRHQSKLFVLVDTFLVAMFWKLYLHPRYAWRKGAYMDLIFMGVHYWISLHFGMVNYLLGVWLTSVYIFLNFALSHTHLPVTNEDENLHWVEYSLLHTVDIEPNWWVDWWMCFLNYQIEHHLFPTMPQFRHPLVKGRVEALAAKNNLPYQSLSYWRAMKKTFNNLEQVSQQLKMKEQE